MNENNSKIPTDFVVIKNKIGCPCGQNCCNNPSTYKLHKKCNADCEEICEKSYVIKCKSCNDSCYCDL